MCIYVNYKDLILLLGCDIEEAKKAICRTKGIPVELYTKVIVKDVVNAYEVKLNRLILIDGLTNENTVPTIINNLKSGVLSDSMYRNIISDQKNINKMKLVGDYKILNNILPKEKIMELEGILINSHRNSLDLKGQYKIEF